MKKGLLLIFFIAIALSSYGQVPAGYYNTAQGLNGTALRAALHTIIKGHVAQSYPLWNWFPQTDSKGNTVVWDIYSDKPSGTPSYTYHFGSNECGNYNSEGDCYNHEHSWPQSFFNGAAPMYSDLFHLYPTDGYVNNKRSNLPYGKVNTANWTSTNGSKLGNNASSGAPASNAFEPINDYKGDVARSYFYMSTRYYTEDANWQDWEMANKAELKPWAVALLLDWHHNDPVSTKEKDRNNAIYQIQNNRNPFIDSPKYVDCIWGNGDCSALSIKKVEPKSFTITPNPAQQYLQIHIMDPSVHPIIITIVDLQGRLLKTFEPITNAPFLINIEGLTPGPYAVKVDSRQGAVYQLFLKQ